jgi:hypothetical protein
VDFELIGELHDVLEPRVFGPVDHTHPTDAQPVDDAIVRDGLTNHLRKSKPLAPRE